MPGPDFSTPRGLGAFVLALKPDAFIERGVFDEGMKRYLEVLRGSPARDDCKVMAPGDREWAVAAKREREGAPVDPVTRAALSALAEKFSISPPEYL